MTLLPTQNRLSHLDIGEDADRIAIGHDSSIIEHQNSPTVALHWGIREPSIRIWTDHFAKFSEREHVAGLALGVLQIYGLSPGGNLVAGRLVSLVSTRSSACHPEVKGMSTGAERSRLVGNARGADPPGAFGVLA